MSLLFAVVAIKTAGNKHYISGEATVPGLGEIDVPTRAEFCRVAGTAIFKEHPEISEVHFVGPRKRETAVTRESLAL